MSFYSYLSGYIEFENKEDFEKVANAIIEGGWYNPKTQQMFYEGDEEVDPDMEVYDLEGNEVLDLIDFKRLSIGIPSANYRNLDRVFSEHLCGDNIPKFKGEIRGDSDDGVNDAWVYRDGQYFGCDLYEYAQIKGMPMADPENSEDYWMDRDDVIEAFLKEPEPKANSQKFIEED